MGYACPVCATPQRDGEHLAHHLAFTAMLHGDDHEAWLDEHVSDWAEREPVGLAAEVTPHADDAEYHEVFEDTVDRGRPDVDSGAHAVDSGAHAQDRGGHGHGTHDPKGAVDETGVTDPESAAALREAREMTRQMFEDGSEDDESGSKNDGTDETTDGDPTA